MHIDKEAIEEFKELYEKEYGVKLSDRKAYQYGSRLVMLVKAVYGDNPPDVEFDEDS